MRVAGVVEVVEEEAGSWWEWTWTAPREEVEVEEEATGTKE